MKPTAIISTNDNPDYLSLIPIVCKSWELQGFAVVVVIVGNGGWIKKYLSGSILVIEIKDSSKFSKIKSELNPAMFTQVVRLYVASQLKKDRYCVLSDADMFIASSFLNRDFDKINVFGHNLTGYDEVPVCYVSMKAGQWAEIFGTDIDGDIEKYGQPHSKEWHKAWGVDQQILTAKLKEYGFDKINFIDRPVAKSGLPQGRWDRYGGFKKPEGEVHDVHLMRDPLSDENFHKIAYMCMNVYPKQDWRWLYQYRKQFLLDRPVYSNPN